MVAKTKVKNAGLIPLAVVSLFAAALILAVTSKYGPGLSHDSAAYFFAAESLNQGSGLVYFGYGTPFVQWPPGYSTLLYIIGKLGAGFMDSARYINSAAFGMVIFLSSLWLYRNLENYIVILFGSIGLALSLPLIDIFKYAWSEPPFILFIVMFLMVFESYLRKDRPILLILSAMLAALACLIRYTGTAAAFTGLLLMLFRKRKLKEKLKDAFIFAVISLTPLGIWLLRNYIVFSTLTGNREPSRYSLIYNIKLVFETLASWFLPFVPVTIIGAVTAAAVCIILAAAAIIVSKTDKSLMPSITIIGFAVIYTGYIVASASIAALDPIGSRLLSPVHIPIVLILLFTADRFCSWFAKGIGKQVFAYIAGAAICLWLIYNVSGIYSGVSYYAGHGAGGYSDDTWQNSVLVGHVESIPEKCTLYSNYPDVIYLMTGRQCFYLPKKDSSVYEYGFDKFKASVKNSDSSYILWFRRGTVNWTYDIEGIRPYFHLDKLWEEGDGVVYRIE